MAEPIRKEQEETRKELFLQKYQDTEKVWSGGSFLQYQDYKVILSDLPVSQVAVPLREYRRKFQGNLDYVYGEMLYSLSGYEGYLRDKGFHIEECFIQPIVKANTFILEFNLRYRTKEDKEETWSAEAMRLGETKYLYFLDYYRPV